MVISGCSTPVVYAVWDRENRVQFPAPRQEIKVSILLFCLEIL